MGFFKKIIDGLKKTQQNIGFQIKKLFKVGIFNDDFYENLEEILLTSVVCLPCSVLFVFFPPSGWWPGWGSAPATTREMVWRADERTPPR